jgi:hypothetical protein
MAAMDKAATDKAAIWRHRAGLRGKSGKGNSIGPLSAGPL